MVAVRKAAAALEAGVGAGAGAGIRTSGGASATASAPAAASAPVAAPAPSVFSRRREIQAPRLELPPELTPDSRLKMDGLEFLGLLPAGATPVAFFDPQYRGVLDKLRYGNEGKGRGRARCELKQMSEQTIGAFIRGIDRALTASGHLFLWMDKFHLCTGFSGWLDDTALDVVDMLTWDKDRLGMGYRSRRASEHLVVLQKAPRRAKGVWTSHDIPDVWREKAAHREHAHRKPVALQRRLIEAVSNPGDLVIDPAAGSFGVLEACAQSGRRFLGCDLNG